ncbi:MAG: nitroreductase family protein [Oscillospiraceae bacterium]
MIELNKDKCIGCGKCAKVCPGLVLKMEGGYPMIVGEACISCGHCQSTCLAGAIYLTPSPENVANAKNALEESLLARRSIRNYKPESPKRAMIEEVLNLASWAPSSKNQNLNGWTVILGGNHVRRALESALDWCREHGKNRGLVRLYESGVNLITCDAPCLIFSWIHDGAINPEIDCAIAMTTAQMLLHDRGLGTCWGGFCTRLFSADPELLKIAGIPDGAKLCCTLMVGYADEDYLTIPNRPAAKINWKD